MKKPLSTGEEKLFRNLDKRLLPHSAFSFLTLPKKEGFAGKRRGKRFFFYRQTKRLFPFFSPTLWGKAEGEEASFRVGRSRPLTFLGLVWVALLGGTGISLLPVEWDFALYFLIPALLILLFLFLIPKKEKELLEKQLDDLINGGNE